MYHLRTRKTMAMAVTLLQLIFSSEVFSLSSHADRIVRLPGQPNNVGFQQFSGYVSVDDKKHKALFYYFVESEIDPPSKPLVLWLNGGLQSLIFLLPTLCKVQKSGQISKICHLGFKIKYFADDPLNNLCRTWLFFSGSRCIL